MTQPTLLEMAEEIERLTEGRIPLDRASWIALYIQRLEGGMTHEQAIAAEEQEHAERGQPSPYQPAAPQEGHKPQSKVGQYISCQTCHKPAGDQATKESGTCQDCKGRIIREGRQREANRANLRAHLAANS